MKHLLKSVCKRYLLFIFFLSFASIILSPDFHRGRTDNLYKLGGMLFVYRFNIFSIFSLLFATLTTLISNQERNVDVAVSMSGMHSFRVLRPVYLFAVFLSLVNLGINQFYLGESLQFLRKDHFFSDFNKNISAYETGEETFFYQNDFSNFTYLLSNGDILYAKNGTLTDNGIQLYHVDHFSKKGDLYEKVESKDYHFLEKDFSVIKNPSTLKTSASLSYLFYSLKTLDPLVELDRSSVFVTFCYRLIMPLLNIWAVALASLIGFSNTFRKRKYQSICIAIFFSIGYFYLLECSSILAAGNKLSPFVFILLALFFLITTPIVSYIKKV